MLYKALLLLLVSDKQRKNTTFTLRIFLISAQREKQMKNYKESSIQKLHIHIPKDWSTMEHNAQIRLLGHEAPNHNPKS